MESTLFKEKLLKREIDHVRLSNRKLVIILSVDLNTRCGKVAKNMYKRFKLKASFKEEKKIWLTRSVYHICVFHKDQCHGVKDEELDTLPQKYQVLENQFLRGWTSSPEGFLCFCSTMSLESLTNGFTASSNPTPASPYCLTVEILPAVCRMGFFCSLFFSVGGGGERVMTCPHNISVNMHIYIYFSLVFFLHKYGMFKPFVQGKLLVCLTAVIQRMVPS